MSDVGVKTRYLDHSQPFAFIEGKNVSARICPICTRIRFRYPGGEETALDIRGFVADTSMRISSLEAKLNTPDYSGTSFCPASHQRCPSKGVRIHMIINISNIYRKATVGGVRKRKRDARHHIFHSASHKK